MTSRHYAININGDGRDAMLEFLKENHIHAARLIDYEPSIQGWLQQAIQNCINGGTAPYIEIPSFMSKTGATVIFDFPANSYEVDNLLSLNNQELFN